MQTWSTKPIQCCLLAAGAALSFALGAAPPSDPERAAAFAASLSMPAVQRDLQELQALADASGGNRAASEPGHAAAADYVQAELAGSGLRVWRESFTFKWEQRTAELVVGGRLVDVYQAGDYTTPAGGVRGELMLPPDGHGCTVESWGGVSLAGRVALFRPDLFEGGCWDSVKMLVAQRLGATAAITLPSNLPAFQVTDFPMLYVRDAAAGERLWARLAGGEQLLANVQTAYQTEPRTTFNLFAETAGEGPVIMLGAHLDSVPTGPGMDDNGSGSAVVLEVARRAAEAEFPGRLRFAWWGAEEYGMVGSTRYLESLSAADPGSLASIRAYLNADMVGSPNYVLGVYSPELTGPQPQLTQIHAALADYFPQARVPFMTMDDDGMSDHVPFRACGLAYGGVSSFIPGRGRVKSVDEQRLFGGTVGAPYSAHYHSANDRLENVSLQAVESLGRSLAYGMARLALDPPAAVDAAACRLSGRTEQWRKEMATGR